MIPIARPIIGDQEEAAVLATLYSGRLVQGERVRDLEEAFAAFCGVREAVAMSSGTAALMTALTVHGLGPGDEVITTPFTFAATANAVLFTGARPVFVDVRADDFNIDPSLIEAKVTSSTRAILPVHLFGQLCDMAKIMSIANGHGLLVIEDAAQAHGATFEGKTAGSFGTGCFSFYATKNMTTGEGGMITTNDPAIAEKARLFRAHGESTRYLSESLGYNFRMTEMEAALGKVQLTALPERNEQRRANAAYLTEHLRSVITPKEMPDCRHVYHQYTVRVPSPDGSARVRDDLAAKLTEAGIETKVFYPVPLYRQPLYLNLGYDEDLPVVEQLSREVLSFPVHPALSHADLQTIVEAVNDAMEQLGS